MQYTSFSMILDTRTRRRKPKESYNSEQKSDEESAFVKAAAWAWYQRSNSGGSEGSIKATTSEIDPTRTHRDPRPSRYKLEAMRMASSQEDHTHTHTHRLSLLDAHEIRSITMRLDSLILESRSSSAHNKLCNGFVSASGDDDGINGGGRTTKKKKKKMGRGIWVRHGGVICSTREEDVADVIGRRRMSSAKSTVPAVHLPKCFPRAYTAV